MKPTSSQHVKRRETAVVRTWLAEPLPIEVKKAIARLSRAPDVRRIAVMPDVHLAERVCVGNVVATTRLIYPQAVGGDIGCGMAAIAFDADADHLRREDTAHMVLDALVASVPTMRHPSRESSPQLPSQLAHPAESGPALSDPSLVSVAEREGRVEFGTLGRGNHFVEFQTDDEGRLWLMVHSGSRYMGQAITAFHLRRAAPASAGLRFVDADATTGQAYLGDVEWARAYADANRVHIVKAAASTLGRLLGITPDWGSLFSCDHNHVRLEEQAGQRLWVHRKGAASAADGEPGIIPGSMGTHSFHVRGRGCDDALRSSSHGAGRALSRDQARRGITAQALAGEMNQVMFDRRLSANLREEAPTAYKDIDAVMRAQRDLTRIVRRLRPVLVYKGV